MEQRARPALVLGTVCAAVLAAPFGMVGVSVALPDLAADLHTGLAGTQWIINGYSLTFASTMLAFGSLADLFGRRRLFSIGVGLYVAASLACLLAGDIVLLNAARVLAGAGAAALVTGGSAMLAETFAEGPARARAFGVFGTVIGLGLTLAPTMAGALTSAYGWRAVFGLCVAISGTALALTPLLPESRNRAARRVDRLGTITFTGSLALFILALTEGPQAGWGRPVTLGAFAGSVGSMAAFVVVERRQADPMMDLSLLARPKFLGLCVTTAAMVTVFTPLAVGLPSYFIAVDGISARTAGIWLLFLGVPTLFFPVIAGYLTRWVAPRHQLVASIALGGAGAAWLTSVHPGGGPLGVAGPLVLIGTGVGLSFGLLDGLAVSSVEPERAGMAAGMFNTMRIGWETVSIAVVGTLLVSFTTSRLAGTASAAVAARPGDAADLLNQGNMAGAAANVPAGPARVAFVHDAAAAYTGALHLVAWIIAAVCALAVPAVALLMRDRRSAKPLPDRQHLVAEPVTSP
ncbi:MFS transporter [Spirillospora sp. NPDC048911]|uniref:MFS transporter n=1 Tax=Spirillospora sp. NPDC048911 TaxID=3364527 RepID=UPI0037145478